MKSHLQAPEVTLEPSYEDGEMLMQVPSKRVARLMDLGLHAERAAEARRRERKASKAARKKNRGANRGR